MKSEASLIKNNPKKGTCREKSTHAYTHAHCAQNRKERAARFDVSYTYCFTL